MDARKRAYAGNPRARLPLLFLVLAGEGSSALLLVAVVVGTLKLVR